ncbi:MAG: ABC transporter ATP-binding protein [Desulfobacteraceae bacterium]|jgi:zinc transport system ATP-binding protein
MHQAVVKIEAVSFTYNGQTALENVNLTIAEGDFMALIGPNGGGKTTLIKLMIGLLKPQTGTIRILGRPPASASHQIGYVPQNTHINPSFPISAIDVVLMGQLQPGSRRIRHSQKDRVAAHEALDKMGMGAYCDQRMGELSGGQRQRVFIARALVCEPKILLLDEPTAHIDTKGQTDFYQLLKKLNQEMTIVVVSHDLLLLSPHVKSVTCVNRRIHYHPYNQLMGEPIDYSCPCTAEEVCPVELVSHRLPLRVLRSDKED